MCNRPLKIFLIEHLSWDIIVVHSYPLQMSVNGEHSTQGPSNDVADIVATDVENLQGEQAIQFTDEAWKTTSKIAIGNIELL